MKNQYEKYVDQVTPTTCTWKNVMWAMLIGGCICTLGEGLGKIYAMLGMEKDMERGLVSVTLIFLSVLLTALNIYPRIAKFGGAGTLVPITGFANSVASAAIEAKVEGMIFGVGGQIFKICGPVILYGTVSSFFAGIIYAAISHFMVK